MRPDLDAIRAHPSAWDIPALLRYIRELETLIETVIEANPWTHAQSVAARGWVEVRGGR